jgi:hypothetical protein
MTDVLQKKHSGPSVWNMTKILCETLFDIINNRKQQYSFINYNN